MIVCAFNLQINIKFFKKGIDKMKNHIIIII